MSALAVMPLEKYRDSLAQIRLSDIGASGQPWLMEHRREAARYLRQTGFPQRREEAWRYTRVDRLLKHDFTPVTGEALPEVDLREFLLPRLDSHRVVFVNGRFAPLLSALDGLPHGVTVGSLKRQIARNPIVPARWLGRAAGPPVHAFSALNMAATEDGLYLHIAKDRQVERPIEVLHLTTAPARALVAQTRSLLLLEEGARVELIERFAGLDGSLYFNNGLSEVILQDGAELAHYRLQEESPAAFHLHSLFIEQHAHSRYRNTGFAIGGAWSRTELKIDFRGTASAADLDGLYLAGEQQLTDVHLDLQHSTPGCQSQTNYKGLLHGQGRAVFDGRIEVRPHAGKSEAHLHNANLLLSRHAEVDTKPQLEIHADDVQCSHGTTVGQLDPDQLFYLRSRGIEAIEARRLLCLGFAGEVLQRCGVVPLRERIENIVSERLSRSATGIEGS